MLPQIILAAAMMGQVEFGVGVSVDWSPVCIPVVCFPRSTEYVHYHCGDIQWLYSRKDVPARMDNGERIIVPVLNNLVPFVHDRVDSENRIHRHFYYRNERSRLHHGGEIIYANKKPVPTSVPEPTTVPEQPKPEPTTIPQKAKPEPTSVPEPTTVPEQPKPEPTTIPQKTTVDLPETTDKVPFKGVTPNTERGPVLIAPMPDVYNGKENDILPERGKNWSVPMIDTRKEATSVQTAERVETKSFPRYNDFLRKMSSIKSEEPEQTRNFPRY